jgi:hypothetical protein
MLYQHDKVPHIKRTDLAATCDALQVAYAIQGFQLDSNEIAGLGACKAPVLTPAQLLTKLAEQHRRLQTEQSTQQTRFTELSRQHTRTQQQLADTRSQLDRAQTRIGALEAENAKLRGDLDLMRSEASVDERIEQRTQQLRIFEKLGLSPEENAFRQFCKELKRSHEAFNPERNPRPHCYISYAWDDTHTATGAAANAALQRKLLRLESYLYKLGFPVFLDIRDMHGNMPHAMTQGLDRSGFVLLMGTPRLKQRVEADRNSNVAFEFQRIVTKANQNPHSLLLLMLEGDDSTAFPDNIAKSNLVHDLRDPEAWLLKLAQIATPTNPVNAGILPNLYGLWQDQRHTAAYKAYVNAFDHFQLRLREIAHTRTIP